VSDILELVLTNILEDMINAQNQANICSAHLAQEYRGEKRKEELLEYFDIPCANIKSFDFELKFGLESATSPLGSEMSHKLTELIKNALNEFIQRCTEKYKLPAGSEEELKGFISSHWNGKGDKTSSALSFEPEPKLIDDCNNFITTLKKEITSLTDSELFLDKNERTSGLRAILKISDLSSYNGDLLCSISVKAEIIGMKAGYADKTIEKGSSTETKRKIYLVNN
jgi:hypothetical protein